MWCNVYFAHSATFSSLKTCTSRLPVCYNMYFPPCATLYSKCDMYSLHAANVLQTCHVLLARHNLYSPCGRYNLYFSTSTWCNVYVVHSVTCSPWCNMHFSTTRVLQHVLPTMCKLYSKCDMHSLYPANVPPCAACTSCTVQSVLPVLSVVALLNTY